MEDIRINNIAWQSMIPQVAGDKKVKTEVTTDSESAEYKRDQSFAGKQVDLGQVIEDANKSVSSANKDINFQVNKDGEPPIIIVTDRQTGKVIRQIPSEEMIRLSERMDEFIGLIFNGRV